MRKDKDIKLLKYQELKGWMLEALSGQGFKPGDRFYTETWVSKKFGIAPMTVRKAFSLLEDENFLRREQGNGTFVLKLPEKPVKFKITERCNIGVLISRISDMHKLSFGPLLVELAQKTGKEGYMLNICTDSAAQFLENQPDGIVLFGMPEEEELKLIKKSGIPLLAFGRWGIGKIPCVHQRQDVWGKKILRELIAKGRKRISVLYFGIASEYIRNSCMPMMEEELNGRKDISLEFVHGYKDEMQGILKKLFSRKSRPDAIILTSWEDLAAVVQAIERHAIRVPEDMGFISLGGENFKVMTEPRMSMLVSRYEETVETLINMLIRMICDKNYKGENIAVDADLNGKWTL